MMKGGTWLFQVQFPVINTAANNSILNNTLVEDETRKKLVMFFVS